MQTSNRWGSGSITERPLIRFLITGLILAVVFYMALRYMDKLYSDAEVFKYDLLAEEFESSINLVRMGWNERGRPSRFRMQFQFDDLQIQRLVVRVNKSGWPINVASDNTDIDCLKLWQYFAEHLTVPEGDFVPLVDIDKQQNMCTYRKTKADKTIWTMNYNTQNGRVLIENKL